MVTLMVRNKVILSGSEIDYNIIYELQEGYYV